MDRTGVNKGEIRFYLTVRPAMYGRSQIVLRLYRADRVVSETVIGTVVDSKARMILLMSRMQLFRLGYDEQVLTLPHVETFQTGSIRGRS
jgi:hypothetical protein